MVSVGTMTEPIKSGWSPAPDTPQGGVETEPPNHPPPGDLTTPAIPLPQKQRTKWRHLQVDTPQHLDSGEDLPPPCQEDAPLLNLAEPALEPPTAAVHIPDMVSSLLDLTMEEFQEFIEGKDPTPPAAPPSPRHQPRGRPTLRDLRDFRLRPLPIATRAATSTPNTRRPTRHPPTPNKMDDWSLTISKKWVVLGDSNVTRFPTYEAADLQVDGFPGAKWKHAEAILLKATITCPVEKLVLSFGLNNRSQRAKSTALSELQATLRVVSQRFPDTQVFIPEINIGPLLPHREQAMLRHQNAFIRTLQVASPSGRV
ncbi:uncharacterized protein LOC124884043 [Girardinichthys multiradiatus]|uniref:uncharacterized protein LOC124884043 n=1 Tax=Girardinichthys multiradiatus TaxID=208333 RepID=UPI001FAB594C|nr:uncharacterized protein LOC124884043 [Girardinichthys multiradiatus]